MMDQELEAPQLGCMAADALLTVLQFHDKTISSLNEAYQDRIQKTVQTLWPLRPKARCLELAHLEIASEAAVTCVEMFNEKNPAQRMNLRWVYQCVQNLLTLQLVPELLGDGTVARLRDPAEAEQENHGDGEEHVHAGVVGRHPRSNNSNYFDSSLSSITLGGSYSSPRAMAAWIMGGSSDGDDYDDDDDGDESGDDEDDDDEYDYPVMSDDETGGLDFGPMIRNLEKMPDAAPTATAAAATGAAIKKKEPKTPWTEEDIRRMVRLKDYEGLTHEEVAIRIGRGKGSVENKYGRVVKEDKWKRYAEGCRRDAARAAAAARRHHGVAGPAAAATASGSKVMMTNNKSAAGYGKKRNRPHDQEDEEGEEEDNDDGDYDGRVGQRPLKKKQRF